MEKKCKFCNEKAEINSLCKKHYLEIEAFNEKKREMYAYNIDEMRVIERMIKMNPDLAPCPICGSSLEINHWKKEENKSVPYFICRKCGFKG